ncbi:hypothetical protein L1987_71797 [Smallanthus sonchifolius]|uniref:Uncharacterized protein n=1 Tax=Smallanthus sonchifolius TaxID=185202 RepID=A0ACB9AT18_9ASTR|nr:hypothetical protein L1987_71797 [Smallanthus sonchifolius]
MITKLSVCTLLWLLSEEFYALLLDDINVVRYGFQEIGWETIGLEPKILSLIPVNTNEIKPESSPISSKVTPEIIDPEPVDDLNDNKPPQEDDPGPGLHEKEKDSSSALDDHNLQIVEQREHTAKTRKHNLPKN